MRIILVRHGLAEGVSEKYSEETRPLTQEGRAQIHLMRNLLDGPRNSVTGLWCSPYTRAMQTAEILFPGSAWKSREIVKELLPDENPCLLVNLLRASSSRTGDLAIVSHQPLLGRVLAALLDVSDALFDIVPGTCLVLNERADDFGAGRVGYAVTGVYQPNLCSK